MKLKSRETHLAHIANGVPRLEWEEGEEPHGSRAQGDSMMAGRYDVSYLSR